MGAHLVYYVKRALLYIKFNLSGYLQQNIDPSEHFKNSSVCVYTTSFYHGKVDLCMALPLYKL